jgi:serine/threonine-protein kinase
MTEPKRLGKYEIIEEIGRGSYGVVYKARDTTLDREVALKVLHPQLLVDQAFAIRLQREARILARLRHPHIVTVYEVDEVDGSLYIAMDLAQGPSLATAIGERGRIPWEEVRPLLEPVCEALDYAHRQGIVHRDLKPSNILLDEERGPLLADFGIARLVGGSTVSLTSDGVVGTPAYIAPEMWNDGVAEARADIYALGCIVYEMVTGDVLFASATVAQSIRAHHEGPQFPAQWPEGVPDGVESVLGKALAREPQDRFASADQMAEALGWAEARERKSAEAQLRVETEKKRASPAILSSIKSFEPEMILIPAGEFLMGSDPSKDKDALDREQPQHTLYLPDYYIAKTPVTNAQYLVFAQDAGHQPLYHWKGGKPPKGTENHPVVNISWLTAMAYCGWLAGVTGKPYRLPTEAEWEKAARGTNGRIYPWGDQWDAKRCNCDESWICDTTPVGEYSPIGDSPYGCADMAGNVWEWTSSLYKNYPYDPTDGREDLRAAGLRALRGGAYDDPAKDMRCAACSWGGLHASNYCIGFRVCVVAQED